MLPGPRLLQLIALERVDAGGERPGVARRAQTEIDVIERALGGRRGDRRDEALGQPGVVLVGGDRAATVALQRVAVVIIEQDQIEIRGRGQLLATELAHGEQRDAPARHPAMLSFKFGRRRRQHALEQQVGEPGEAAAELAGRGGAGDDADADQELLFLGEDPGAVEDILVATRLAEEGVEPARQFLPAGQRAEELRFEQSVHHMRPPGDRFGQIGRVAHHHGEQRHQRLVGGQQREQLDAGRQAGEEMVEGDQRGIRRFGFGEGDDEARRDLGQKLAGPRRPHGRVAAEMPGGDDADGVFRPGEAELGEGVERAGIDVVAGEHHVAVLRGKVGLLLEQLGILVADGNQPTPSA